MNPGKQVFRSRPEGTQELEAGKAVHGSILQWEQVRETGRVGNIELVPVIQRHPQIRVQVIQAPLASAPFHPVSTDLGLRDGPRDATGDRILMGLDSAIQALQPRAAENLR
jgi:hypothetical protein